MRVKLGAKTMGLQDLIAGLDEAGSESESDEEEVDRLDREMRRLKDEEAQGIAWQGFIDEIFGPAHADMVDSDSD